MIIFRSRARSQCAERALVLQALDIPFEIQEIDEGFALVVDHHDATEALQQLDLYTRENRGWPPKVPALATQSNGLAGVVGYCVVLLTVGFLSNNNVFSVDWYDAGKLNAGLVRDGEWWRTLTALTLHLDLTHLVGNLLFGAAFGLFAGQFLGAGLAWSTILAAGAMGNTLNALVQNPAHTAVGASTAVFAALGLLSAYIWKRRQRFPQHWAYRWGPVIGGIALLAYTGTGDERTDIVAHLTGFLSGFALGTFYGVLGERMVLKATTQWTLGATAIIVLAFAWLVAVT